MKLSYSLLFTLVTSLLTLEILGDQTGKSKGNKKLNSRTSRQLNNNNADQMVQNILQWLQEVYGTQGRRSRSYMIAQGYEPPYYFASARIDRNAFRQGSLREYLPPTPGEKPRPFTPRPPTDGSNGIDEDGNFVDTGYPPAGITPQPPFTIITNPVTGGVTGVSGEGATGPGGTYYPAQSTERPGYSTQTPQSTERPVYETSEPSGYPEGTPEYPLVRPSDGYPTSSPSGFTGYPSGRPTEPTGYTPSKETGFPTYPTSSPSGFTGYTSGKPEGTPEETFTSGPEFTGYPTSRPTGYPSIRPTGYPTGTDFTGYATGGPTGSTTRPNENGYSTGRPETDATGYPTGSPTGPTTRPNGNGYPTGRPGTDFTGYPTGGPTTRPNGNGYPTGRPATDFTGYPTGGPTTRPNGNGYPTGRPGTDFTGYPTGGPTESTYRPNGNGYPTGRPGTDFTGYPAGGPTTRPNENGYATGRPGTDFNGYPSEGPTGPTTRPNGNGYPTGTTGYPNVNPTGYPTVRPTEYPTETPAYPTRFPVTGYPTGLNGTPGYTTSRPSYPTGPPTGEGTEETPVVTETEGVPIYPTTKPTPQPDETGSGALPGFETVPPSEGTTKVPVDVPVTETEGRIPTEEDLKHPPHIHALDVQCAKDMMTINIEFNREFNGVIYSKGYYNMPECRYVNENSGQTKYTFTVNLNMCGTEFVNAFDTEGQSYLENILVLQNEVGIQEVWDTIRSVRCLWEGNLKEQLSVTLMVGMLSQEIVTFSGDTAMAKLDVLLGRGPFGQPASGLVKIGENMTLVVSVSGDPGFDVQVKQCRATDSSGTNVVALTDDDGCILKPKLFGAFQKTRNTGDTGASIIAYAYFNAFKFPDVMDIMIECNIELCKTDCEMCSDPNPQLEPGRRRRRRDLYSQNETLHDSLTMAKHLRVVLPEDLAAAAELLHESREGDCISTQNFVYTSSVLVSLLTASCLLSAYLWITNQKIKSIK